MDADTRDALRALLHEQRVAALGTLHQGEPAVSMVPYARSPDGPGLLIHVSALASHTRDMQAHARVSLMVMATMAPDDFVQALPRATLQGVAQPLANDTAAYARGKAAYLARFPQAELMFDLGDFSLWCVTPDQLRFVAGFGRAHSASEADLAAVLG